MAATANTAPEGTQSVQRAAMLLRLVAGHNRAGLRIVDLCRMSGLRRPTVHRLLLCLVSERLVVRNHRTRNYHLGPMLYELGLTATPHVKIEALCRPYLRELADRTGDMVFLTLRSGFDAVCIDRLEGEFWIRTYTLEVGTRRPLGIGAGSLAILSALPEDERREALRANAARYPGYNGMTAKKLAAMIAQARRRGFAVHDGSVSGARAIGIPLHDAAGSPFAAVSVSAVMSRMQERRWPEIVALMRKQAESIERELLSIRSGASVPDDTAGKQRTARNGSAPGAASRPRRDAAPRSAS